MTYANDDLTLYFSCGADSQKVRNIRRNRKVSLTIDHDEKNWNRIRGISLGATARLVNRGDPDYQRGFRLMRKKFPEMGKLSEEDMKAFVMVKVTPKVISLLDYTKGFGHTELVRV